MASGVVPRGASAPTRPPTDPILPPMRARYHSLDALRAAMMLLGIVLHGMASYAAVPPGDAWPFRDAHTSPVFVPILFVIHLFRMPAFFAVAGFFAALLHERDGDAGFIRNRARRVLAPLFIFWAAVGPFVIGGFYFAITYSGSMTGDQLIASVREPVSLSNPSPMHLWFLWYLVLFYAATLVVVRVTRGWSVPADVAVSLTTGRWSLAIWASLTALTLLPMNRPVIELSALLLPDPRPVVAYAVFFLFGWLLYRGRAGLGRLAVWWSWRTAAVGIGASVAGYGVIGAVQRHPASVHIVGCLIAAVWMWLLVLASFGAFLRYAHRERPVVRYLSDAAYWIYIVHLPVVIWTAGLLSRAPIHAGLKFAVVFMVTTVVCVASYHAFVRRTAIGQLLNGRRYGLVPGNP